MKSSKLIMGCLATLGLTAGIAVAQDNVDRDAIAERLKPVGDLCMQGEDCGTAMASNGGGSSDSGSASSDIDGGSIYGNVCAACHESGAAGAPIRGDEDAWSERTGKGFETLLSHSINGFNAMPARGGNPNLSDEEMQAATAYLVEPVMDVPDLGGSESASEDAASEDEMAATEEASQQDMASTEDSAGDAPSHAGIDGEAIYNQVCMACHNTGAAGAPVRGEADQWSARLEKGMATLYDHSINGFNAMPAKGGNPNLSDDEVKAATDYLVEAVQ